MQIHVATSTGAGSTALAAFDSALNGIGAANYNLIYLSSVIPPESKIVVEPQAIPASGMPGNWGDRLYVVMAQQRETEPGTEAWAGVGWVQEAKSGKGLFVEHEGTSEGAVRGDIEATLKALMQNRGVDFGQIHMAVQGITCKDIPVCAMAVAVYQASDWRNHAELIGA